MPRNCSLISSIFQKRIGKLKKMKYFADDSAMEFKLKFSLEMIIESLNVFLGRKYNMLHTKLNSYHKTYKNGK